jgi:hypothetical protein
MYILLFIAAIAIFGGLWLLWQNSGPLVDGE